MSLLNLIAVISSNQASEAPPDNYFTPLVNNATVSDNGLYEGFPFPDQHSNGMLSTLWKRSGSHAANGPLMLGFSYNGGATWDIGQVSVDGDPVEVGTLWKCLLPSGRMLIGYIDASLHMKFAYSDNPTTRSFTLAHTFSDHTDRYHSPIKGVIMPSGKVKCYWYKFPASPGVGNPMVVGAYETMDGITWTDAGETIISHDQQATGGAYGQWMGHETAVCITHNTGVDATCKMIAIVRTHIPDDGGTFPMVYRSSDGGETWETDLVSSDALSFVDENGTNQGPPLDRHLLYCFLASNSPFDIIEHNGLIYVVNGMRNLANGYKLQYITATPDGAFRNRFDDWTRPTTIKEYNAATLGGSIDCGYPLLFKAKEAGDGPESLWVQDYDISTEPKDPMITEDRCWIKQVKIADAA